jgi:hypothetical protein
MTMPQTKSISRESGACLVRLLCTCVPQSGQAGRLAGWLAGGSTQRLTQKFVLIPMGAGTDYWMDEKDVRKEQQKKVKRKVKQNAQCTASLFALPPAPQFLP